MSLAESLFTLHLNKVSAIEAGKILTIVNIAELVTYNTGIADGRIYVGVRVSEYPRIDTAVGNEVAQLRCEGTIQWATFMLWCNDRHCRQMMGYHHNMLGGTLCNTTLDCVFQIL